MQQGRGYARPRSQLARRGAARAGTVRTADKLYRPLTCRAGAGWVGGWVGRAQQQARSSHSGHRGVSAPASLMRPTGVVQPVEVAKLAGVLLVAPVEHVVGVGSKTHEASTHVHHEGRMGLLVRARADGDGEGVGGTRWVGQGVAAKYNAASQGCM
jgi:hypothetical protein